MERLTNSNKEIPTLFDNAEYWLQVYFKLKDYEDLEERLNKIYGDCGGLLESMVELLEEHSGVDIPDDTVKVLLITNESVDFYKKCKSLEKQGKLAKLPHQCRQRNRENLLSYHTNADKIRHMSDEELAEWLTNMCDFEKNEEPYKSIYNLDTEKEEEIHDSYGDLLKWLQSEAE